MRPRGEGHAIVAKYPDPQGRQSVRMADSRRVVGYVRALTCRNPPWWFPIDAEGFPLEGTCRTRHHAVTIVLDNAPPPKDHTTP